MREILNRDFLISIVWVNEFVLSKESCTTNILCIEDNIEVTYLMEFKGILYTKFRQENLEDEFEVIDTVLEKFNDSKTVSFMHSEDRKGYWVIEFISGPQHLVISFNSLKLTKKNY
jgi:hypothetical protein